jgi:hypothetical protein
VRFSSKARPNRIAGRNNQLFEPPRKSRRQRRRFAPLGFPPLLAVSAGPPRVQSSPGGRKAVQKLGAAVPFLMSSCCSSWLMLSRGFADRFKCSCAAADPHRLVRAKFELVRTRKRGEGRKRSLPGSLQLRDSSFSSSLPSWRLVVVTHGRRRDLSPFGWLGVSSKGLGVGSKIVQFHRARVSVAGAADRS